MRDCPPESLCRTKRLAAPRKDIRRGPVTRGALALLRFTTGAAAHPRWPQRRRADRRRGGSVWRDGDPRGADRGEGGGWGDLGVGRCARVVFGEGVLVQRPGGVRG